MKKKQKSIFKWKPYEWEYLCHLLNHGYTFIECLHLLNKDSDYVDDLLKQGFSVKQILIENEQGKFYDYLSFFISVTSLPNAISCALHIQKFEEDIKKKLIKESTYPVFIFMFAYFTMIFFLHYVIPQLMMSFESSQQDTSIMVMITMMRILVYLIAVFLMIAFTMIVFIKYKEMPKWIYAILRRSSIVSSYISYKMAGYCKELDTYGLSSRKMFTFLMHLKEINLFHECIEEICKEMENGYEIFDILDVQVCLNDMFCLCYQIGAKSNTLQDTLSDYMHLQEQQWSSLTKRISIIIQCIAYSFVALLVIFVYQIMLVPLQMLETM